MSSAINWRSEDLSTPNRVPASNLLREETLDSRLSSLREVALTLLQTVESLESAGQPRPAREVRLHDEVRRFEADLIRTALLRTGGNQAGAARLLGVKHTTLNAKIKRYGILLVDDQAEADNTDQEIAA